MRIGIDASRANMHNRTGTEWYSYFIIREILSQNSQDKFVLYVKEPLIPDMADLANRAEVRVLTWRFKFLWNLIRLSWEILIHPPDVLFVPAHTIPIISPKRTVTTCHDIGFERYPLLYAIKRIGPNNSILKQLIWICAKILTFGRYGNTELDYHRFSMRLAIKRAARIITPSRFTAREIIEVFGCSQTKITVIPHGLNPKYLQHHSESEISDVLTKYGVTKPYLLFLGRWEDKKNISLLLKAFDDVASKVDKLSLVLAGRPGWGFDRAWTAVSERSRQRIILLTNVQVEASILMSGAKIFVFPSAYEGFGLPIIEAMASNVPVITTRCASIPEIAGDSVAYCDGQSDKDLSRLIIELLTNEALRRDYQRRGLDRARTYHWEKAGRETLKVLCDWGT